MPTPAQSALDYLKKNLDYLLVLGVIGVIFVIFVPVPTWLIDILLVLSMTIAILVLLTSIYVRHPLEFSVFPSILLLVTVFRLSLNIATTRLILANARGLRESAAGQVIRMAGEFVAGADPVIGLVIFTIIIIIQFVVITRGATRISEVAARFTLDAMPGKQMAIDADLNAGSINEGEARRRREQIGREADFYGAMDGATKFVRGDAVAGLLVVLVNIFGGLGIGVLKYNMPLGEAARTFTLLTVGDGLVAQIPAVIISLAAGILVSRSTTEANLGRDIVLQSFSIPKALGIASGFLALLLVTPLPKFPLLTMALGTGLLARTLRKSHATTALRAAQKEERDAAKKPERVEGLLHVDPMEIEVGYGLIRLVDPAQGGTLLDRVTMIRRQTAVEFGLIVPPIRIRDNMQLEPNQYTIKIRGVTVGTSTLRADQLLAMDAGAATGRLEGTPTEEPVFHLPALWVPEAQKERAEALGYTVVDATTVLATHLTEVIKTQAADILTREDVNTLLKTLKETNPAVVDEVVDKGLLKVGEVQKILQSLLREGISIRDLGTILETVGDYAAKTKDPEVLTEFVRAALARPITQRHTEKDGKIYCITLDPRLEDLLKSSLERAETGSRLTLAPASINKIVERLRREVERLTGAGHAAVVLCAPQIRAAVKRIADRVQPGISVLSYNEIVRESRLEAMGMVSMEPEPAEPAGARR